MEAKKLLSLAFVVMLTLTLAIPMFAHEGHSHETEEARAEETTGAEHGGMSHSMETPDAAPDKRGTAAEFLHGLGLLHGVGTNADGHPDLALDKELTRAEAFTLFLRLIDKEGEAHGGNYSTPFTDVPAWAAAPIGYAYEHGLASGASAAEFNPNGIVTAPQYLTIILRGLGYRDGEGADFEWSKSYVLTDRLGITKGEYAAGDAGFTRADAAAVSYAALSADFKDGSGTFIQRLVAAGTINETDAIEAGLSPGTQSGVNADGFSELVIDYSKLWTSNISLKVGVPVKWHVYALPGSLPTTGMSCGKTIRIPGYKNADGVLWTAENDQENGHITLVEGRNFIYEFTPTEVGDILFTCWMGPECHANYIHVTEDGTYSSAGQKPATEAGEIRTIKVVFNTDDKKFHIDGEATDIQPTVYENAMGKYNTIHPKDILDYAGIQQSDALKFETSVNGYASEIALDRIYNDDLSKIALTAYEVLESKNEQVSVGYIDERLSFEIRVTLFGMPHNDNAHQMSAAHLNYALRSAAR